MANEKRSINERINQLKERKKQITLMEQKLKAQQTQTERKERTKRLIEIGAVVESVLGKPILKDDLLKLKSFLEQQEQRGKYFSKAMSVSTETKQNDEQSTLSENDIPY
jgi:hypothetical protein